MWRNGVATVVLLCFLQCKANAQVSLSVPPWADEGDPVVMTCNDGIGVSSLQWSRSSFSETDISRTALIYALNFDGSINIGSIDRSRYEFNASAAALYSLTILSVNLDDEAKYWCRVSNAFGQTRQVAATLSVRAEILTTPGPASLTATPDTTETPTTPEISTTSEISTTPDTSPTHNPETSTAASASTAEPGTSVCPLDASDCLNQGTFIVDSCECACPQEYTGLTCQNANQCVGNIPTVSCPEPGQYCKPNRTGFGSCRCEFYNGFQPDGDSCVKHSALLVTLTFPNQTFNSALKDPTTSTYKQTARDIENATLTRLQEDNLTAVIESADVAMFTEGSVKASIVLTPSTNNNVPARQIVLTVLARNSLLSPTLILDTTAITIGEATTDCAPGYCLNAGSCVKNGVFPNFVYVCGCLTSYSGKRCEVFDAVATVTNPTVAPDLDSRGWLVGGIVLCAVVVCVVIVCSIGMSVAIIVAKRRSSKLRQIHRRSIPGYFPYGYPYDDGAALRRISPHRMHAVYPRAEQQMRPVTRVMAGSPYLQSTTEGSSYGYTGHNPRFY